MSDRLTCANQGHLWNGSGYCAMCGIARPSWGCSECGAPVTAFVPHTCYADYQTLKAEVVRLKRERDAFEKLSRENVLAAVKDRNDLIAERDRLRALLADVRVNSKHPRHEQWRQECDEALAQAENPIADAWAGYNRER